MAAEFPEGKDRAYTGRGGEGTKFPAACISIAPDVSGLQRLSKALPKYIDTPANSVPIGQWLALSLQ